MNANQFFELKNGGKSAKLMAEHQESISPTWAVQMIEEYATLRHSSVIKPLPEYNEILYHARTLTDEQFREYWNEVQGNIL